MFECFHCFQVFMYNLLSSRFFYDFQRLLSSEVCRHILVNTSAASWHTVPHCVVGPITVLPFCLHQYKCATIFRYHLRVNLPCHSSVLTATWLVNFYIDCIDSVLPGSIRGLRIVGHYSTFLFYLPSLVSMRLVL